MYDSTVSWSGWYRLFINSMSAQIPDTCVEIYGCSTQIPLWIRGGHPTVTDGVVTRDVCGHWNSYCCYFGSFPIKVKACPGNYYVYELVSPTIYHAAYCAGNYIHMNPLYYLFDYNTIFIGIQESLFFPAVPNISSTDTTVRLEMTSAGNVV
ncbi:hypothetical protein PO909_015849 [Leuciscus waleckii]